MQVTAAHMQTRLLASTGSTTFVQFSTADTWRLHVALECKSLHPTFPLLPSERFHQLIEKRPTRQTLFGQQNLIPGSFTTMNLEANVKRFSVWNNRSIYGSDEFIGKSPIQVRHQHVSHQNGSVDED